jgi:hypothetical protein
MATPAAACWPRPATRLQQRLHRHRQQHPQQPQQQQQQQHPGLACQSLARGFQAARSPLVAAAAGAALTVDRDKLLLVPLVTLALR